MLRRDVLKSLLALAAAPTAAFAEEQGLRVGQAVSFSRSDVLAKARSLAKASYVPRPKIPQPWLDLSYDEFRGIWFDTRNAYWEKTDVPARLDVFPAGLYFPRAVDISIVEGDTARPLVFDIEVFDRTDKFPDLPADPPMGFSGLRLRAELETPGIHTEYAVFQGASYFRAIGNGQIYGLSARGLAIDTAEPSGEEFPDFVAFWVEQPEAGQTEVVVHALMDSPSCSGAYRFRIEHGPTLVMDVEADIFPRTDMRHVGVGPLTSMFMFDETMRHRFYDFRPAVHDSDGLLIRNGAGETIWRPLNNPVKLQISAFSDNNPKGFGLMQRAREFGDFADLEALYHRRPGLWVTPGEDWGTGSVVLVEIPTDREIYDNIVAYWRPSGGLSAGSENRFTYTLDWGVEPDFDTGLCKVLNTAIGTRFEGGVVFVIDFEAHPPFTDDLSNIEPLVQVNAGEVTPAILQRNPETGGPRLAFTFDPGDATLAEFRTQLRVGKQALSEVWLYRWTV